MTIAHLMNKSITILRLADIGDDKMALTTGETIKCQIQPATDDKRELTDGVFGKQFRIYVDGASDAKQGDRIRDKSTNEEYTVLSGGETRRTFGSIDYTILLVELTK